MPKISVIVPVYETEAYLPRCIESILSQSFTDFELILVDDGSPDNSGAICDKYAEMDARVKVIHQENAGVSSARNRGIEAASGEYIVFVDSDDWVSPAYLLDLSKSEADFVSHSFSTYDEKGRYIKRKENIPQILPVNNESILMLLKEDLLGYTFSKRFITKIVKQNGIKFEEKINHTEDTLFIIDYLQYALTAEIESKDNYCYVRYSTRATLSNGATLDRLAMVCTANEIICKKFFPKNSKEYEELFYSRVGYSYMSYIGNVWYGKNKGFLHKYLWICNVIKNDDVIKIMKYAPDALWKLPLNERVIAAIRSGNKAALLAACVWDGLTRQK